MNTAIIKRIPMRGYATAEALNTICSSIMFSGKNIRKVLISSSSIGDGKSYTSLNLAISFANRGMRVLLIDTDLRRSKLQSKYGIKLIAKEQYGLAHYLAGYCEMEKMIYQTNVKNLYLIPIGKTLSNSIPLISSASFRDMLNALQNSYDLILLDTPPVGLIVDAVEMAKYCDGAVLVASYNETHRRELAYAKRQIEMSGCNILGCIINKVDFDSLAAKKYYNKSYYSHYEHYYSPSEKLKKHKTKNN